MIKIIIWNDKGEIIIQGECKVDTVTDEQMKEMVKLIEAGCPAHTAARLVKCEEDIE